MSDELEAIIAGLRKTQKMLSPKYFYDDAGSRLFEEITELPEYYLTDTELEIMTRHIDEMTGMIGEQAGLIEFGSGSSMKTRMLLEHMHSPAVYVPVDISEEHLYESQLSIQADFPEIEVLHVVADFTQPFDLPNPRTIPLRNVVYFPGSTIGNFEYEDALSLLRVMHTEAGANGALLIGVDLQKDPAIVSAAYNDSAGVTAKFNLNILRHLNRAFGSDFNLHAFAHRATYRPDEGRVVIELVSNAAQVVHIGDVEIEFADGESIITEYSHKYTLNGFADMAAAAGFEVRHVWTDPQQWFSVQYCVRE
jgi:dimethylhistidine N-methyltransferase